MITTAIDQERLSELRTILGRLDPSGRRAWLLEIYNRVDGEDRLQVVMDIKTGKPLRAPRTAQAEINSSTDKEKQS